MGNDNFGYTCGRWPSGSEVDRIDYSNDNVTTSRRGSLNIANNPFNIGRWGSGAAGNKNFGYVGGGTPVNLSIVDRIDYSNDLALTTLRGPLSFGRLMLKATGNLNFGYFGGGSGPLSIVDRIDYANDTAIASVRGPLSVPRGGVDATTNARNS